MVQGKLLIIEDDRATRDALQGIFISRGWEVAMAETQADGLALLLDYNPDWVIVAWQQLRGTGESFLRRVREGARGARVALLTEAAGTAEVALAKRLKPDLSLAKPLFPEDVYRACVARGVAQMVAG